MAKKRQKTQYKITWVRPEYESEEKEQEALDKVYLDFYNVCKLYGFIKNVPVKEAIT